MYARVYMYIYMCMRVRVRVRVRVCVCVCNQTWTVNLPMCMISQDTKYIIREYLFIRWPSLCLYPSPWGSQLLFAYPAIWRCIHFHVIQKQFKVEWNQIHRENKILLLLCCNKSGVVLIHNFRLYIRTRFICYCGFNWTHKMRCKEN